MSTMAGTPTLEKPAETKTPRRVARHRVESLMYVELGPENGGFPINISEDGMAFQGIKPLELDQEISITIKLDGVAESVIGTAKIVWLTESRKGGGLRFIEMPEASRRLINDWIALQGQADSPRLSPIAAMKHIGAMDLRPAPAVTLAAGQGNSPAQTNHLVASESPNSQLPMAQVGPANIPNERPNAELAAKISPSKEHSQPSEDMKRAAQVPIPLARGKKKQEWIRPIGFMLGLAAALAMIIVSGTILWPMRGVLLGHSGDVTETQTNVQPAPAPTAALPPQQTVAAEPTTDLTTIESPPVAPIENVQENLVEPAPLNVTMSAPSHPAENRAPLAPKTNRQTTSKVPAPSAANIRPAVPAIVPAKIEQPVAVTPNPVSESAKEVVSAPTAGEMTAPVPAKIPENPVSATGSVEIIPDPYPSIRLPAESKARFSRPVNTLQIGHLVSKAEPAYPAEALQQRIAGTVKVHVIIGENGTVEKAELLNGPSSLADAALRAVQQLRYEPTILGGEAIEVEGDVTLVFRITSPPPAAN